MKYFKDPSNPAEWVTSIASLLFTIPIIFGVEDNWVWEVGAIAILLAWINFLLYLQRYLYQRLLNTHQDRATPYITMGANVNSSGLHK